jgi:hypothetical protein
MKTVNFQWFSVPMEESTDVSDRMQLAAFFREKEFNMSEWLVALCQWKEPPQVKMYMDKSRRWYRVWIVQ